MLKNWGWIGLILIILVELNFIFKIQPFYSIYFPIVWIGYILFIDSLVFRLKGKSLISNNFDKLLGMFIISPLVWWLFEFFNISLQNWHYINTQIFGQYYNLFALICFSVVIPAFFETFELFKTLFKTKENHKIRKIKKSHLYLIICLGVITLVLSLLFPKYCFPLIWICLFLILDPINYMRKQPSLINQFMNKKGRVFLSIIVSILLMGFLWEFWNFYAQVKWVYTIPFFKLWHVFEMPLLGYLGYIPFAFELYSIYYFVKSLF